MRSFITLIALGLASIGSAQEPQSHASCTSDAVTLPSQFAAWRQPVLLEAIGDKGGKVTIDAGQAAQIALLPTPQVRYALRPEKPGGTVSYGGMVWLSVQKAGTYRIGLSSGAWIDVVRDGKAITSSAHGHGPDCSGIRKIVDFSLVPGRYLLQIAASGEPQITAMLVGPN